MQTSIGSTCRPHLAGQRFAPNATNPILRPVLKVCKSAAVASAVRTTPEDKWIARTVKDVETPPSLAGLREAANGAIATLRMPTTRNEDYRFTDISPLLRTTVQPAPAGASVPPEFLSHHSLPGAAAVAVLVDGRLRPELSRGLGAGGAAEGVYVGPLEGAPRDLAEKLGCLSGSQGGPFAALNGGLAAEVVAVAVRGGGRLPGPVFVLHLASGSSADLVPCSAPRLLLHAGPGAHVELVQEFVTLPGHTAAAAAAAATQPEATQPAAAAAAAGQQATGQGSSGDGGAAAAGAQGAARSLTVGVTEVVLEEEASVRHSYVQREAPSSFHFQCTLVRQAARSAYTLTEAAVGGGIARHDLNIVQAGPETRTDLAHFLLCGAAQLHDLHSRLLLDHRGGEASQLHKCIVSHASGRGVFDGNVKVGRGAQKTDARQLSRNLLLAPLATVNVKPNLQIVADDVKCTHGCAVSDLRDEELFYFRARGISADAARQALVYSFGSEVVQRMQQPELQRRVQADVAASLRGLQQFAGPTGAAAAGVGSSSA